MNLIKSHKIVTVTILVGIIGSAVGISVINHPVDSLSIEVSSMVKEKPVVETVEVTPSANKKIVDENGLNAYEQCMVKANEKFMQYLEDNSTTYKFDDGTVINLPDYDGVIEEAKHILKTQEQEC